jgi:hypothetical protein
VRRKYIVLNNFVWRVGVYARLNVRIARKEAVDYHTRSLAFIWRYNNRTFSFLIW